MAPSKTTTTAAAALHTIVIVAAILVNMPVPTSAVLGGSYIPAASFASSHPFRGAVQSGGGTGIVLFRDGDEAVILTVAHGYDLTTKTGKQVMDFKLNSDGGLRSGFGSGQKGYVMPADNIEFIVPSHCNLIFVLLGSFLLRSLRLAAAKEATDCKNKNAPRNATNCNTYSSTGFD